PRHRRLRALPAHRASANAVGAGGALAYRAQSGEIHDRAAIKHDLGNLDFEPSRHALCMRIGSSDESQRVSMAPLASVIMPCFNAGGMLAPALKSAFEQTYPDVEIGFVDNNSTDGSAEQAETIAASYQRPFRLVRCAEQGCNPPRNAGYAA